MNPLIIGAIDGFSLLQSAHIEDETAGFLLYDNIGDYDLVTGIIVSGTGSAGSVEEDPDIVARVNRFIQENDLGLVDFHTHTPETIRKYGDHYAENLSKTDMKNIRDGRHLLVTPSARNLYTVDEGVIQSQSHPTVLNADDEINLVMERLFNTYGPVVQEYGLSFL